jgi:hypothetical protein
MTPAHGPLHSPNLLQMLRCLLDHRKPSDTAKQRASNHCILRRMRFRSEGLAADRGRQASPGNPLRSHVEGVPLMVRDLARACPRCNGPVKLTLREPGRNTRLQAVNGHCLRCAYRFAWIVIRGNRGRRTRLAPSRLHAQNP